MKNLQRVALVLLSGLPMFFSTPDLYAQLESTVHSSIADTIQMSSHPMSPLCTGTSVCDLHVKDTTHVTPLSDESFQTWNLHFLMQLYPNPAVDIVRIHLLDPLHITNVVVLDLLGRQYDCRWKAIAPNVAEVDTHALPSGVYPVVVNDQFEQLTIPVIITRTK